MLIRAGYELSFAATAPTPMVAMLSVLPERIRPQVRARIVTSPPIPTQSYVDGFGNVCTRLTVPPGGVTLSCDFVIEDDGRPDRQSPFARQHGPGELPTMS